MTTPRLPESTRCVSATLSLAQQLQGGWHQGKSEEYVRSTETEGFVGESRQLELSILVLHSISVLLSIYRCSHDHGTCPKTVHGVTIEHTRL
ncbi:hypothetical protein AAMO2058_001550800 [Amorphochlora amoebiformis]